jgi:hypothetical protein
MLLLKPVDIAFPTVSEDADKPNISAGRIINGILEQAQNGDVLRLRAPGLKRLITPAGTYTKCRGMIDANGSTLLAVYDGFVEAITGSGASATTLGPLAGDDIVTLARNNAATPDVVCVSPQEGAFELSSGGAPVSYTDPDVGSPLSVCFGDGYFFFVYGDGSCIASGINTTAINALDVATAESSPDGLLRGVFFRGQLFLMGPSTIEVWQNTAEPTGFPFSRATVIQRGLAGTNAVAGWEGNFTSRLIWVGSDNIVYALNGYEPVRISHHSIEHDLQRLTNKTSLNCFVFMNNGHPFWVMKSDLWTWVYDLLTSTWQERASYGRANWRGECSHYMFGDWLIGDDAGGYIFRPDAATFKEDNDRLVWSIESQASKNFANRMSIPRADFFFSAGQGNISGELLSDADPQVLISWSNDGGATFGNPLERYLGKGGKYNERVTVNRTGQAGVYGRKWRLQVSDPVYIALVGGTMEIEGNVN